MEDSNSTVTSSSCSSSSQQQQRQPAAPDEATPSWSIAVKTVGGGVFSSEDAAAATNPEECAAAADHNGERNFTVLVSPEDGVTTLHDQIEQCTGLKASQQRLIYRGRLIGLHETTATTSTSIDAADEDAAACDHNNQKAKKLKEIAGLGNGQTIHLVKKRDTVNENETTTATTTTTSSSNLFHDQQDQNSSDAAGSASLLAALLGLGSPNHNHNNNEDIISNTNNTTTLPETAAAARRWGGWRPSSRGAAGGAGPSSASPTTQQQQQPPQPRRRPHYRLTADDLVVPDPGSMESVRQGLLTLHTLAPHARPSRSPQVGGNTNTDNNNNNNHPLSSRRTWYLGQWLDCRDTVNQWLEATVIEIVLPQEILPNINSATSSFSSSGRRPTQDNYNHHNQYHRVAHDNDPPVSAEDLEGRRRLLLEPDGGSTTTTTTTTNGIQPGFRLRDNHNDNDNNASGADLQLLLLHYNGWPHRWDEWIRSDSERIRPFRTRTRHSNMSSTASPTPQSIFHEAPSTNIRNGDEAMDRVALPVELERALSVVLELLRESIPTSTATTTNSNIDSNNATAISAEQTSVVASDLPWIPVPVPVPVPLSSSRQGDTHDHVVSTSTWTANVETNHSESWQGTVHNIERISDDDDDANADANADDDVVAFGPQQRPQPPPPLNRRQLELLAPLLDRLGRTLVDAAPHIASLSASLPYEEEQAATTQDTHHPPTISEVDSNDDEDADDDEDDDEDSDLFELPDLTSPERHPHHAPLGGLLSILSNSRSGSRRHAVPPPSSSDSSSTSNNHPSLASSFELAHGGIDPDHVDYATGLVNTSRGEVRSGPRGSNRSSNDDVASLLGAYLAAASLGGLSGTMDDALGNGDNNNNNTISGLGRLLRERGTGGGGGIDIHIHAVVTAPGVTPGGLGFATLGGGATTPMATATPLGGGGRNIFSTRERSSRTSGSILRASRNAIPVMTHQVVEDDQDNDDESSLGLFSELYSENPTPIDPNGSPASGERQVDTTLQEPTDQNSHRHHRHSPHDVDPSSRAPRMMSPGLRNDSLTLSPARRSLSSRRSSTERPRATGWTRFFRRRGRSNSHHNNNNNNSDSQYDL